MHIICSTNIENTGKTKIGLQLLTSEAPLDLQIGETSAIFDKLGKTSFSAHDLKNKQWVK